MATVEASISTCRSAGAMSVEEMKRLEWGKKDVFTQ